MLVPVVVLKDVASKITIKIAPYGMDVVGLILDVVVFDQKRWPLNPVVVGSTYLGGSGPGKGDFFLSQQVTTIPDRFRQCNSGILS